MQSAGCTFALLLTLLFLGTEPQSAQGQDAAERPGVCPEIMPLSLGTCSILCTVDADCEEGRKCCRTGCDGYSCKIPDEKPGLCPVLEVKSEEPCVAAGISCLSDNSCTGSLKCCHSSCGGYTCQNPTVTTTTDSATVQS